MRANRIHWGLIANPTCAALILLAGDSICFCQSVWQLAGPLPDRHKLRGIVFDNNRFVAVGDSGTVLYSHDGTTWSEGSSGITITLNSVTYGNGQFLAVGVNGMVATSSDGAAWRVRTSGTTTTLHSVTFSGTRFVAVGDSGVVPLSLNGL
jgi:photosystem II stability/assembly factor-like uncharacterized protein